MMALQAVKQTALVIGGANAVGYIITAALQTHKLTDLIGTGSFVLATIKLTQNNWPNIANNVKLPWFQNRLVWVNIGVVLWGTRLGSYLFHRILQTHEDKRLSKFFPQQNEKWFDKSKSNFPIGLSMFWGIQALWGFICMLPVTIINSVPSGTSTSALLSLDIKSTYTSIMKFASDKFPVKALAWVPVAGIFAGIFIESLADYQKSQYRSKKENEAHWCDVGLWSLSRYPNYFGEMLTWWSIYFTSLPTLFHISSHPIYRFIPPLVGILSPAFISFLLFRLSGIPLLERKQQKQYGNNPEYQNYVKSTPLLIPLPKLFATPSSSNSSKKTN